VFCCLGFLCFVEGDGVLAPETESTDNTHPGAVGQLKGYSWRGRRGGDGHTRPGGECSRGATGSQQSSKNMFIFCL